MRTERDQGLKTGSNYLASSVLLVCRQRTATAPTATRREFMAALKAERIEVDVNYVPKGAMPSGISTLGTVYMSIEGLVDVDAEIEKLTKELAEISGHLANVKKKLANSNFVDKAPRDVVAVQEKRQVELQEKSEKLVKMIETMRG